MNLVIELGPKAITQFKKYHPLKASISYTNPYQTTALIKAIINTNDTEDVNDMANWILFLGGDVILRTIPKEVGEVLQERLSILLP